MRRWLAPLECRWSLKENGNFGFTNCALDDSIWIWEGNAQGHYRTRKLCSTGKLPAGNQRATETAIGLGTLEWPQPNPVNRPDARGLHTVRPRPMSS